MNQENTMILGCVMVLPVSVLSFQANSVKVFFFPQNTNAYK